MIRGSGDQEARCTQADALAGGDWRGLSISVYHGRGRTLSLTARWRQSHARRGGETKRGWAIRAPVRTLSVDRRLGGRLAARRALRPSQVVRRPLRSVSASAFCSPGLLAGGHPSRYLPLTARVNSTGPLLVVRRVPFSTLFLEGPLSAACRRPEGLFSSAASAFAVSVCFAFARTTPGLRWTVVWQCGSAMRVRIKGEFKCGGKLWRAPFRRRLEREGVKRRSPASVHRLPKAAKQLSAN